MCIYQNHDKYIQFHNIWLHEHEKNDISLFLLRQPWPQCITQIFSLYTDLGDANDRVIVYQGLRTEAINAYSSQRWPQINQ